MFAYVWKEKEGDCPSHVIVMCKGRMYRMETLNRAGKLITPPEIQYQLEKIVKEAKLKEGPGLGILTCDERTSWAKVLFAISVFFL